MGDVPELESSDDAASLRGRIRELESQNDQLLKERDSAVGMAGRILSRLRDTLNLGNLEAQAHDRLVQSYTDREKDGG